MCAARIWRRAVAQGTGKPRSYIVHTLPRNRRRSITELSHESFILKA